MVFLKVPLSTKRSLSPILKKSTKCFRTINSTITVLPMTLRLMSTSHSPSWSCSIANTESLEDVTNWSGARRLQLNPGKTNIMWFGSSTLLQCLSSKWSTHCGNMTSYPFLKMAAATAEYYFRFRICWYRDLKIGVRGHSRSLNLVPFESLGAVSYSPSIVTMAVSACNRLWDIQRQRVVWPWKQG